jgi:hypothetical protein
VTSPANEGGTTEDRLLSSFGRKKFFVVRRGMILSIVGREA